MPVCCSRPSKAIPAPLFPCADYYANDQLVRTYDIDPVYFNTPGAWPPKLCAGAHLCEPLVLWGLIHKICFQGNWWGGIREWAIGALPEPSFKPIGLGVALAEEGLALVKAGKCDAVAYDSSTLTFDLGDVAQVGVGRW